MTKYYLKSNVVVEPLCWKWYAWSHLISPLTASMNITFRHLRLMENFINKPNEYRNIKNQKFESGPIVQLKQSKKMDVTQLLEETKLQCKELIELATNIKLLSEVLLNVNGGTLENIYPNISPKLRGLVELVYDINHHAGIRFFEPLLYQDYYTSDSQGILLYEMNSDWRPFILGTPRIEDDTCVYLPCKFDAHELDAIFKSQRDGIELQEIINSLAIPSHKRQKFISFFTETPPARIAKNEYQEPGVRVRYFGHACVLLQTKEVNILLDPLMSYQYHSGIDRYTYDDLPNVIDYVLITHAHQDHFSVENLLKLKHRIRHIIVPRNSKGNIADPSLKYILQKLGFQSIYTLNELDSINVPGGQITALPFIGEHAELDIQSKLTYGVNLDKKKFYFAVDANNFDNHVYERAFKNIAPIDVMFIGMECDGGPLNWLYGSLITTAYDKEITKTRTLSGSNFPKAYALAKQSQCKEAYVYSMGQEPWLNYIMNINYTEDSLQIIESNKFIAQCRNDDVKSERLFGKKEWIYK